MLEGGVPKFFFHIYDSVQLIDERGTDLPSLDAARRHAVTYAAFLLNDHPDEVWSGDKWSMEVTDAAGFQFFRIDLSATQTRKLAS